MSDFDRNYTAARGFGADRAVAIDAGLRAHMIRVYNYMASGLALSGIVAFALFSSSEIASLFFQVAPGNRVVGLNMLGWVAILAPLGLLLLVGFRAQQMSVAPKITRTSPGWTAPDTIWSPALRTVMPLMRWLLTNVPFLDAVSKTSQPRLA